MVPSRGLGVLVPDFYLPRTYSSVSGVDPLFSKNNPLPPYPPDPPHSFGETLRRHSIPAFSVIMRSLLRQRQEIGRVKRRLYFFFLPHTLFPLFDLYFSFSPPPPSFDPLRVSLRAPFARRRVYLPSAFLARSRAMSSSGWGAPRFCSSDLHVPSSFPDWICSEGLSPPSRFPRFAR